MEKSHQKQLVGVCFRIISFFLIKSLKVDSCTTSYWATYCRSGSPGFSLWGPWLGAAFTYVWNLSGWRLPARRSGSWKGFLSYLRDEVHHHFLILTHCSFLRIAFAAKCFCAEPGAPDGLVGVSSSTRSFICIYYHHFPRVVTKMGRGGVSSKAIKLNVMSTDAFLRDTLGWKLNTAFLIRPI